MEVLFGTPADIDSWMRLVCAVSAELPGLETPEKTAEHRATVLRFMDRKSALCVKIGDEVAGVMLISGKRNMICCLAVLPEYRRRGIAARLLETALAELDSAREITVTTFRENDARGIAPRALYKKYGFEEGELVVEFDCPNQIFVRRPHT